jgi:hypothetical protein
MPETSPTRKPLNVRLEAFAIAVAEGASKAEAAERCGYKKGSAHYLYTRPRVQERIVELKQLAQDDSNTKFVQKTSQTRRQITFGRNEIIMKLADLGGLGETPPARSEHVQFECVNTLAEIFLLKAKNLKDLLDFYGLTADELDEYARTGSIPERIRSIIRSCESGTGEESPDLTNTKGKRSDK